MPRVWLRPMAAAEAGGHRRRVAGSGAVFEVRHVEFVSGRRKDGETPYTDSDRRRALTG